MTTQTTTQTTGRMLMASLGGFVLGLLVVGACGGGEGNDEGAETDPPTCEHGTPSPCVCTDGSMGTQMCAHDSSGFEACMCTGEDSSGTTTTNPVTSTSDGESTSMASTTAPADGTTSSTGPDTGSATTEDTGPVGAPPMAQINHPGDGEDRQVDVPIPFIGVATDPEDGPLSGTSMVWTSDVEGQLGEGETFDAPLATLGMHVITLTATDSDGNVGEDSIAINVVP